MDEPLDRSPVDKRDDYYGGRSGRSRSRSRSPGRRQRSRSASRDRRRSSHRDGGGDRDRRDTRDRDGGGRRRSRSRSRSRDRGDRRSSRRNDDDVNYPGSSTRGGYGGGGFSSRGGRGGGFRGSRGGGGGSYREESGSRGNREAVAQEAIQKSKKENRVYVGNLSFQVRWHDLKEFCGRIGPVAFSEIIQLPNGMSKGCGVVEYTNQDDAQRAIKELNEQELFGRPVFLREDREEEARYGSAAVSNRTSFPGASYQTSGSGGGRAPPPASVPSVFAPPGPRGLYVTGMSPNIGWQDLKDLFRAAGNVMRADINMDHTTGQSKGTGVVVMESKTEANAAIAMFNGYEFDGGRLEVREDRFYHINAARGAHGGLPGSRGGRGGGGRGGFGGHTGGYSGGGRSTDNLYGDYNGPEGEGRGGDSGDMDMSGGGDGFSGGRGGFGGRGRGRGGFPPEERHRDIIAAAPSMQIFVKNLPWSTSDDDLVELFQTTGTVVHAGIIWENGRSRGNGIVQFASIEEAETAIAKFQNYQYGGRPLGLAFNARWKDFSLANGGGSAAGGDMQGGGEMQGGEMEAQNGNGMDEQEQEQQPLEANEQTMEAA